MAKSNSTTWDERLIQSLIPWRVEIGGIFLFLVASITFLGLLGLTYGSALNLWLSWWTTLLGWGAYLVSLSLAAAGLHLALRKVEKPYHLGAVQLIGLEILLLTALPLAHQLSGATREDVYAGAGGGLIGWILAEPLLDFLGPLLTGLLYLAVLGWALALVFQLTWADALNGLYQASRRLRRWGLSLEESAAQVETAAPSANIEEMTAPAPLRHPIPPPPDELIIIDDSAPNAQPRLRRRPTPLPDIELLEQGTSTQLTKEEVDDKSRVIEETLGHFGLPAHVTEIRRGPSVTQFGVQPGYMERTGPDGEPRPKKVRIGQIAALQKDLALALAVSRLRIEAPVPGRGIVGIEVPNADVSLVRLRGIIESDAFYQLNKPLAVGLGRDVSGAPVAVDLARMPHLLIAGTTGSGKSICINALISSLVFNNTPEQLRLVMIDPKKVELIRFNGLPHLLGNVEVEGDRIIGLLNWLTAEMDDRYQSFAEVGAKNLSDYNRKIVRYKDAGPMPYLCVFIDELADLMMSYPADTERTLCRLAQMARATGIHLVLATQRPSTDVITGLIKANFPARIAFAVASGIDSRVILDTVGAEQLLGRGDMLYLGPDASAPVRLQGVFVTDKEIERLVRHWQRTASGKDEPPPWEGLIARQAFLDERDELLERAIEVAQKVDFLSTSLLQRRLRVGYPRAARLMEHLYEMGLVEDPKQGGKTRKTYVDEEDTPLEDILDEQNGG